MKERKKGETPKVKQNKLNYTVNNFRIKNGSSGNAYGSASVALPEVNYKPLKKIKVTSVG